MVKVAVVKFFGILLCLALALGMTLAAGQAQAQDEASVELQPAEIIGEYAPGELLVKFKPGISSSKIEETQRSLGVSLLRTIPRIDVRVMAIPEGKSVPEMVDAFSKIPWVEYAEPNYRCYKTEIIPDDTYFSSQWALSQTSDHDIDAPESWNITTGNASVIIALIDDGIDYNHEEFPSGKLWINNSTGKPGYDFAGNCTKCLPLGDEGCTPDDDVIHESDSGHGTATAGIAAAATNNSKGVAGVSWNSVIMPLKVENSCGNMYHSYIAAAITFAVDNGAQIISMSLGGPSSSVTLENACQYAWENGTVIVVASGNDNNYYGGVSYPARYLTTIAVGATNEIDNRIYPGNPGNEWTSPQGSNYGPELDVVAPGINIYTTDWSASGEGYNPTGAYISTFGGTSASCPFVAGEAALLLAKDSSLSNERVRSIIRSSAEDQVGESSQDTPGFDPYYGYGRINLYNALFSPTKPDLTLTSSDITFSDNNPSPGEAITISATIHNNGSVHDEINITPFASVPTNTGSGYLVDASQSIAQSFTATASSYLAAVDLAMWDYGADSAYAQIEIQTDSGSNTPSGTAISSTETQDWPSSISWERIKFSNPAKITAGQKYWIVAICPDLNPDGYGWGFNNGSVYAGGGQSWRDNNASSPTWETESATDDCQFKAYIYAYDTVVRFYDGNPDDSGTQIGSDQHLSPVAASGTNITQVSWIATSGDHDIYVVVDPDNLIPESDETNNQAYKSLSVAVEVISFTVTDYGSDGVKFYTLDPGMEDQPADQTLAQGAVTLTVGTETNVDVGIYLKGDDFSDGSHTLAVSNVEYDDDNTLDEVSETGLTQGAMATTYGTAWDTVTAGTGAIIQVYHWLSIPTGQAAGSYNSTFYYQAKKSEG
jgi:thermitase